jgi:NAD(P)-dependent dehydrogenase (short-subunit alcohol dehydrogenase family)
MSNYRGATAIITGAGSGIGLALSKSLVARGAHVWLTDVNSASAKAAAETLGPTAHSADLDVRDAAKFARIVQQVATERSGLDFLFNNAGIAVTGEMHLLSATHFDRIIDVNIRGVMNGVAAAYPLMVKQGHGHIVNIASLGGLLPMPLVTPYSMTKHAIVGLSMNLRFEAESYGVKVCVLCPGAIETPLLDSEGPKDLPRTWRPDVRRYLTRMGGPPSPVDTFAEYALDRIETNRPVIVFPVSARVAVLLNRFARSLVYRRVRRALRAELLKRPVV